MAQPASPTRRCRSDARLTTGVRGGQIIGATDDVGYTVVDRPIHPNDLHATLLKAFGLDERAFWFEHNGRKEIVTDLGGEVVKEVFA